MPSLLPGTPREDGLGCRPSGSRTTAVTWCGRSGPTPGGTRQAGASRVGAAGERARAERAGHGRGERPAVARRTGPAAAAGAGRRGDDGRRVGARHRPHLRHRQRAAPRGGLAVRRLGGPARRTVLPVGQRRHARPEDRGARGRRLLPAAPGDGGRRLRRRRAGHRPHDGRVPARPQPQPGPFPRRDRGLPLRPPRPREGRVAPARGPSRRDRRARRTWRGSSPPASSS